jgi:hypothetical protein
MRYKENLKKYMAQFQRSNEDQRMYEQELER